MTVDAAAETVTITGIGNFATKTPITRSYTKSTKLNIADPLIKVEFNATYTYDGKPKNPVATDFAVTEGGTTLTVNRDFTIGTITSSTNAGIGKMVLNGINNYKGSRTVEFTIAPADIAKAYKIDASKVPTNLNVATTEKYTVKQMDSAIDVMVKALTGISKNSADYDFEYIFGGNTTNVFNNAGDYTVNVKGTGNYTGVLEASVHVNGTQLNTVASIPKTVDDQAYTGKAIEPEIKLVPKSGVTLTKDKDYKVTYKNNVDIGEAMAIVEGLGKYEGQYVVNFNIKGTDISEASVAVDGTYTYTGKAITPRVTVKLGDTVIDPANYDVVATDNTNAGTAKFTIVGE